MNDELTQLIDAGPDPDRELQHLVMCRFDDITAARKLARSWRKIARALGIEARHKSLAAAYWRVRRGVEAKRLAPPKGQPQARIPSTAGASTPASKPPASGQNPSPAPAPTKPGTPATAGRRVTKIVVNPDDYL